MVAEKTRLQNLASLYPTMAQGAVYSALQECRAETDHEQEAMRLLREHADHAQSIPKERLWGRGICCVYAINFLTIFAIFHLYAPRSWLLEMAICRKFYESHNPSMIIPQGSWPGFIIPEHACTKKSIQQDLSHIRAIGTFLEPLPGAYPTKRLESSLN